jgi:transposase
LETGTHANWIHDVLVSTGHEAVVANARKVRAISANERKSDVRDARMLARLGRVDVKLLEPVTVRAEDVRLDLTLVRARAAAVESRTQLINAVRGLAKAAGHRLASCSTSCFHKQALPATLDPALRGLIASIEQISKTIDDYDEKIEVLAREKYPRTKLLTQISGVGDLTALTFVLTLGDTARFKSGRDVGAFFGLVPGRDQSGGRDPQMRITKCGDAMVRTLLVQCAHRVLSARAPDTDLRRFGEKLAAHGGKAAKKRAVVATARKLAVLMFALLRNGEVYEPLRNSAAPTTP